ncbi:MAG: tRNA (N6-isopentenyl adenosine(37)-C2)-methylthiotransferase MiaB, partial [bacterium (Candidatus Ratteibacteria) CG23_combo_of_CG06-09_8_20_14_all_48_7]
LLGQNVNSYQDPQNGVDFPNLMARAARIAGILRLGFLTSHPKDVSTRLFEVMAENKNIYKHLHLPLQSGSDKILSAMNRKYTAEHYRGMITEARRLIPNLSLTSDVIVGFSGETEADFQDT